MSEPLSPACGPCPAPTGTCFPAPCGLHWKRLHTAVTAERDEAIEALRGTLNWLASYEGGGAENAYNRVRAILAKHPPKVTP